MSVFSNDLAPNLFKSYTDWFDNWVKETGHTPEKHIDDIACRYFDALDYTDRRNKMDSLATLKDIINPLHDYVEKQVDYYQSMGLKNSVEIGEQAAYEDVLNKIKQFEFNGRI